MPFVPDTSTPSTGRFVPDIPGADVETQPSDADTLAIRTKMRLEREKLIRENAQPGFPLDVDAGLPAATRARVSFEPDPQRQAKMLPGGRVTADGKNVIARVDGKDVLLHPLGPMTLGTIAGEAAPLAKLAATGTAAALSGGSSLPVQAAFMGLGAAATEGALTGGSRVLAGQDVGDAGSLATKEGVINATLPLAGAVAGKAVKAGLGKVDALAEAATAAGERQGLPLTPSMAKNSDLLKGAERVAGTPNFDEAQRKALQTAKDRAVLGSEVPDTDPFFRGVPKGGEKTSDGDRFYSRSRDVAEEFSAKDGSAGGTVTEHSRSELPAKKDLYQVYDKEELARKLGIDPKNAYGHDFDEQVKNLLKSQGFKGVEYEAGTDLQGVGEGEIHVFGGPPAAGRTAKQGVLAESDIATKTQPIFSEAEQRAAKGVRTAMTDAEKAAQDRIQAQLDSGLIPSNLTQSDAGKFIRGKVETARDAFQTASQKNYGELHRLAAQENLTIPTDNLTNLVSSIKEKDPQGAIAQIVPEIQRISGLERALTSPVAKSEPTGLFDQAGDPIMSDFVPPKVTLPQAIELRAVVNDKIAKGDAVGDIPGRYLKDLAGALTKDIEAGVKSGSPELQAAFDKAKGEYAGSIGKFKASDVNKLFTDPESARALADNEVIPTLFRGKGNLDAVQKLKAVLDPKDYQLLLRQGAGSLVDEAKGAGDLIDASKFLNRLSGLDPELRKELLGPMEKELLGNTRLMQASQGGKFTQEELDDALAAAPGRVGQLLEQAIGRQKAYDQAYNTRIQKMLRDGVLGPRTMGSEDDFVQRFLTTGSQADVRQALTQIAAKDPTIVEDIRKRTLQNILDEVKAKPALGEATAGNSEDVDYKKLLEYARGDKGTNARIVIGKEGTKFLDDLAVYAEANARRLAGPDSGMSAENLAERATSTAMGHGISAPRMVGRALAYVPRRVLGGAIDASPAVADFLKTGTLPPLRPAVLAAPGTVQQASKILQDTRQERQ